MNYNKKTTNKETATTVNIASSKNNMYIKNKFEIYKKTCYNIKRRKVKNGDEMKFTNKSTKVN